MKIPIDWLKEFIDFDASPQELCDKLSMQGVESTLIDKEVIEIEVLPNRGDCLSVIGIAREVSAAFDKPLKAREFQLKESGENIDSFVNIEVNDPKSCPLYTGRVISNVKIEGSPPWLKERLIKSGLRPINNIVDATNYVMLETGQPFHAFDLDKIDGRKIIVRESNKKEKIISLDNIERELPEGAIVIADNDSAVAIGGIMGGKKCEVAEGTKNILLEAAYFDPSKINKASKALKLRSESSNRFEKGIDFELISKNLDRLASVIIKISSGISAKGQIIIKNENREPKEIILRLFRIKKILGIDIPKENIVKILRNLGFEVNDNQEVLNVRAPLFREKDIEREIDLIEEIARIWGYEKIKDTLPAINNISISDGSSQDTLKKEKKVKEILISSGFSEVQTFSMVDAKLLSKSGISENNTIKITNPLVDEMALLRPSLISGLLNAVSFNLNRQISNVCLFEIGRVFNVSEVREKNILSGISIGSVWRGVIEKDKINADFYFLKGIIENIINIFSGKSEWRSKSDERFLDRSESSEILFNNKKIGFLGKLNNGIQNNFSFLNNVYVFELDLDFLFGIKQKFKKFDPIPKFPSVRRDIAMFIPENLTHQEIYDSILLSGGSVIEKIELFDRFAGKGRTSLAYSIVYRDKNKTLTDEEVNTIHEKILKNLVEKLKVEIRK